MDSIFVIILGSAITFTVVRSRPHGIVKIGVTTSLQVSDVPEPTVEERDKMVGQLRLYRLLARASNIKVLGYEKRKSGFDRHNIHYKCNNCNYDWWFKKDQTVTFHVPPEKNRKRARAIRN